MQYKYFSVDEIVPAGGQGIIAIEGRKDDEEIKSIISAINDEKTMTELCAERYLLSLLGFGCAEPVGVFSKVSGEKISVTAVIEKDGSPLRVQKTGDVSSWSYVCDIVFEKLTGRR